MMKKRFVVLLLLVFQFLFAQEKLTDTQKLAATCKVWGFLKYYHPKIAKGDFNWDDQLFEVLPKIEQAKTQKEFSLILENWINSLGEVREIAPILPPKDIEYFDKNFDLTWIKSNKLFSKSLSMKLKFIENNRFQGNQHYVALLNAENIFVKNEDYSSLNFNDKNPRILALFMYWNLMEYFFPYKYLMDKKWDITLEELLPLFIEAKNEDDFYTAMQKLTVRLNDSHAVFYKYPKKPINFFPAKCKIIDEKIIVTEISADSLAKANDIKIGDIITKVNDKSINEIVSENRDLIYGSNEAAYLNNLANSVLKGTSDNVKLEFFKDGKYTTRTVKWYSYHDSHRNEYRKRIKTEKFKILDNNIGYVDMGVLKVKNVPQLVEKLKSTKAIIWFFA
jgi:hypothetical protein